MVLVHFPPVCLSVSCPFRYPLTSITHHHRLPHRSTVLTKCEPAGAGQDSSYRRLDGGATASASASGAAASSSSFTGRDELVQALQEAERGAAAHHGHVHIVVLPQRYVRGCDGDMEEAARRWKETLAWRAAEGVDGILREPQRNFRLIKECYPHYLHRRDKLGHPVYYELLGRINLKKLKANGVTVPEMVRYYVFLTEYIWNKVEPTEGDRGAMVSILDVENVGLMDLRGDALEFLKAASKVRHVVCVNVCE